MKIIDAQVHIWSSNTPERPWVFPEHRPHRDRPFFMPQDLLAEMKAAGVDRAILVPPFFAGDKNDTVLEAAQLYPDHFAVMGLLFLDVPENQGRIAMWKKQPGMLGVRIFSMGSEQRAWLDDGTTDWFWPSAEKAGLPVMVYASGNLPSLKKIAERHPKLKLIVDHMGCLHGKKDEAAFADIEKLCALAQLSNVAVKVGALPCYSNESYPHSKIQNYVKRAYDAFGPKRLFWAADVTRLPCSYSLCKTMMTEEMKWLTIEDLEWIMGRGVSEWLGWPP